MRCVSVAVRSVKHIIYGKHFSKCNYGDAAFHFRCSHRPLGRIYEGPVCRNTYKYINKFTLLDALRIVQVENERKFCVKYNSMDAMTCIEWKNNELHWHVLLS